MCSDSYKSVQSTPPSSEPRLESSLGLLGPRRAPGVGALSSLKRTCEEGHCLYNACNISVGECGVQPENSLGCVAAPDSSGRNPSSSSCKTIMPPKGGFRKKAEGSEASTPALVEQFSYLHVPKPFKNPNYTKNHNRRAKNLKTVLTQEREREKQDRERRRVEQEEAMDTDPSPPAPSDTPFEGDTPTYTSIEAPPSLLPARKYCDITGLEAHYTDPATGLRYHDKNVYQLIKGLNMAAARDYLAARGVNPIVK